MPDSATLLECGDSSPLFSVGFTQLHCFLQDALHVFVIGEVLYRAAPVLGIPPAGGMNL